MSIAQRLWLAFAITCAAIVLMCGIEASSFLRTQELARENERIEDELRDIQGVYLSLREAEAHARGYLLTGDSARARQFEDDVRVFYRYLERYRDRLDEREAAGVRSRPAAPDRGALANVETLAESAIALMRTTIQGWSPAAPDLGLASRSVRDVHNGTELIKDRVMEIVLRGESALAHTNERAAAAQERMVLILVGGGITLLLFLGVLTAQVVSRIYRSFEPLIEATRRLGAGDLGYRIAVVHHDDVGRLATSFNDMAEHVQRTIDERKAAEDARRRATRELEEQGATIEILGKMAHRLQTCLSFREFGQVVGRYVPQVLPGRPGGLYLLSNSRNVMRLEATWGPAAITATLAPEFGPRECWAMRRGQTHRVDPSGREVPCLHVDGSGVEGYHCLPLIAHGDVIGVLYVEEPRGGTGASPSTPVAHVSERQMEVLIENMALALANFRLRETLREQSIRDRLTGLLNRRYLDETMSLELARAKRAAEPLAAVMLDVDHFKSFNDEHGHDAGDAVLRAVAGVIKGAIRGGDVVCRYGGEEFCILMPGAACDQALVRAEAVRAAIEQAKVDYRGATIGPITASAGVAAWPTHGETMEAVLQQADFALYEAKRQGRNRVVAAPPVEAAAAPATAA